MIVARRSMAPASQRKADGLQGGSSTGVGRVAPMIAPEASVRCVIFISQAVDYDDPVIPHTVRWIKALARKPSIDRVTVLALPPAVTSFRETSPSTSSADRAGSARSHILSPHHAFTAPPARLDLHPPGGPYPALLLPVKLLARPRWSSGRRAVSSVARWRSTPPVRRPDLHGHGTSFPMGWRRSPSSVTASIHKPSAATQRYRWAT